MVCFADSYLGIYLSHSYWKTFLELVLMQMLDQVFAYTNPLMLIAKCSYLLASTVPVEFIQGLVCPFCFIPSHISARCHLFSCKQVYLHLPWRASYSFKLLTLWHIRTLLDGKIIKCKSIIIEQKYLSIYIVHCLIFYTKCHCFILGFQFIRIKGLLISRTRLSCAICKYVWFTLTILSYFFSLQIMKVNSLEAVIPCSFFINWLTYLKLVNLVLIKCICIS